MKYFDQEPYAIFFPLGLLSAVLGVTLWIFVSLGWLVAYPNWQHASWMVFGFLISFVTGFLMTAVPRMSGAAHASKNELKLGVLLLCLSLIFSYISRQFGGLLHICQILFLVFFIGRRFLKRTQNPPTIFLYIPVGLLSGLAGSVISLLFYSEWLTSSEWYTYSKLLLYQALILNLIVGLGSRLVPVLSRVEGALKPDQPGAVQSALSFLPTLLMLNISFIIEAFLNLQAGIVLRVLVLAWMFIAKFKILTPRSRAGNLGGALRLSCWAILVSYVGMAINPELYTHYLHGVLIGGVSIMTLSVAVRVVLAHGGFSLDEELSSKTIVAVVGLLVLATLIRVFARDHNGLSYLGHLGVASAIFLIALSVWFLGFRSKLKVSGREGK